MRTTTYIDTYNRLRTAACRDPRLAIDVYHLGRCFCLVSDAGGPVEGTLRATARGALDLLSDRQYNGDALPDERIARVWHAAQTASGDS
jgi:hypothetical protein